MDFGYNEDGQREVRDSSTDSEADEIQSTSTLDDSETRRQKHQKHRSGSSGSSESSEESTSSSDSSAPEFVIGEEPEQSIDEPLVDPSEVLQHGSRRADARQTFYLEGHATGEGGEAPLLLTEGKTALEAMSHFLDTLSELRNPSRLRNIALIGALHHGKTSLLNMWVGEGTAAYRPSVDELERGLTIKSHVVSFLARGAALQQSSHLLTVVDTPGHTNFIAEAAAGLRLAECAVLCVDVVESVMASTEALLKLAIKQEGLPVILMLTKLDRLIVELKLPPMDAYRKCNIVIDEVNNAILKVGGPSAAKLLVSPQNGTVGFSSSTLGFCFSLETFALKYAAVYSRLNTTALSEKLWGAVTFVDGGFHPISSLRRGVPSFVQFILEPLYKIVSHAACGGKTARALSHVLDDMPRSPLSAMTQAIRHFLGAPAEEGLDVLLAVLPEPFERSGRMEAQYHLGQPFPLLQEPTSASSEQKDVVMAVAPLIRLYGDGGAVAAVMRVVRGTLEPAATLVAVDDTSSEAERCYPVQVERLFVCTPTGVVPVLRAREGQIVLVTGIGKHSGQHLVLFGGRPTEAVLTDAGGDDSWLDAVRLPPCVSVQPFVQVDMEVKDFKRFELFQDALETLRRTSPGIDVHMNETRLCTLRATGELHLDTVLRELRQVLCPDVRIGVSQPYVAFSETVHEAQDGLLAVVKTRRCTIGFTCGVLKRSQEVDPERSYDFVEALEREEIIIVDDMDDEQRERVAAVLEELYGFDALDAQHVMGLGPEDSNGPNILVDDTLAEEREGDRAELLKEHRQAIISGYRTAVRAGPLVGEQVRETMMRLVLANISPSAKASEVMDTARTAARQALLGARPRLLEPMLSCETLCSAEDELLEKVKGIFTNRRGYTLNAHNIPGTCLTRLMAVVPAIDSFSLETEIRMSTRGQCFPSFSFSHWDVVPGDPYDTSVRLGLLEPAHGHQLSRDFVVKTRIRKGLGAL